MWPHLENVHDLSQRGIVLAAGKEKPRWCFMLVIAIVEG